MTIIDLRSDTLTLPTAQMVQAMGTAPLGDDGLDGDPTVSRLEQLAASMVGKEQALFVVSGTMGNLVAALTHAGSGGRALVDGHAHIAHKEAGGISRLARLDCVAVPARGGELDLSTVSDLLRTAGTDENAKPVRMVVVESSHNHSGGTVPSLDFMQALHALAARASVPVHLDGARVFNAAIALGVDVRELAAAADSVTFCLSKGLSAPLGSILAGSAEFIGQARWMRRMVGGGLRQAGVVAAAGVVALEQMVGRLRDDHETATLLWEELRILGPELVSTAPPETNIVLVDVSAARQRRSALEWLPVLEARGVKARARDDSTIRLVTHRHVTAADVRQAARAIVDEMMVSGIEAT